MKICDSLQCITSCELPLELHVFAYFVVILLGAILHAVILHGVTLQVTADGIVVEFDLLEGHSSDPPNVPSLTEAIAFMEQEIASNGITVR